MNSVKTQEYCTCDYYRLSLKGGGERVCLSVSGFGVFIYLLKGFLFVCFCRMLQTIFLSWCRV